MRNLLHALPWVVRHAVNNIALLNNLALLLSLNTLAEWKA